MEEQAILFGVTWWEIFLGGISTLAIFTFLYRENSYFRLFEHLYMGIATGIVTVAGIRDFFWPEVLKPLLGLDLVYFPDGTLAEPYKWSYLWLCLPMLIGLLYYCILTKRFSWVAQLIIGLQLGAAGGLAFQGTFNEMSPQIAKSFKPLYVPESPWWVSAGNVLFCFALISTLTYFFFTFRRKPGGVVERTASAGRWIMMGCFGAFFGSTILARMALLVERLEFLIYTWLPNIFHA